MTLDTDPIDAVLQSLLQARRSGAPADDRALAGRLVAVEQAYAVQDRLLAALGEAPGCPRHWKSGGPSRSDPMRHAPLPRAGVRPSGSSLIDLPLRHRWIEAEVALRMGRDVSANEVQLLTPAQAIALADAMCVSIEVLDSRWAGARTAEPLLKLADLLVHGALVLGEWVPLSPREWGTQECRVRLGGGDWQHFRGSLGVGDPAAVLPAWLRHATRHGDTVSRGTVVSCGSWCGVLEAQAGDQVLAEFPGIGAASLQL
ncbi:MAG: fumarylacetoacetate hydrolase family protein [Rhizobacter sp.]|nr:fumarylacetoacetate hydrolase family protein [Rhizobacter sp.]